MALGLDGKVALVTGASRGIGLAIARQLAAEGAQVALVARSPEPLQAAAAELRALAVAADVQTETGCREAHSQTMAELGPVDVLVNNVGGRAGSNWNDTDVPEVDHALQVNLYPAVRLSRLALPAMIDRGWGRIVVISSIYGREAGGAPAYNIAKAAEISFVTSLGREVARHGVTVNAVAPGSIRFPGGSWDRRVQEDPEGMADFVHREMPLGRFGTAEEVASVVAFLCSTPASLVNAAAIAVDGGQSRSNI